MSENWEEQFDRKFKTFLAIKSENPDDVIAEVKGFIKQSIQAEIVKAKIESKEEEREILSGDMSCAMCDDYKHYITLKIESIEDRMKQLKGEK